MMRTKLLILAAALTAASPLAAQDTPGTPALPATLSPIGDDGTDHQLAAAVASIRELRRQGDATVKFYGLVGGDPAMNGHQLYLAFYQSPAEGWRIFSVGDFLAYRIVSETRGRVVLQITESVYNNATGTIGSRQRRIALAWRFPASGEAPEAVSITAAR